MKNKNRRIKTVLYGDQRFSDEELDLLHTPSLQRLYDLHQLGFTDRIFVDASHSRLHHVIGVVEQVSIIFSALSHNLIAESPRSLYYWDSHEQRLKKEDTKVWANWVAENTSIARLMGLLHDLTHAPYGHTLEDEIGLVEEKHDEPRRQAEAFLRLVLQYVALVLKNHGIADEKLCDPTGVRFLAYLRRPDLEDIDLSDDEADKLGEHWGRIILETAKAEYEYPFQTLSRERFIIFLAQIKKAMIALLYLEVAHKDTWKTTEKLIPKRPYPFERLLEAILRVNDHVIAPEDDFIPQRDCYLLDVIGNTICADLLDYAKRDSVSAGLKLDYDAGRIVDNFTLVVEESPIDLEIIGINNDSIDHPFRGFRIRTAIKLFGQKLRTDVPGELLNLLQVRYYVYERMLFHPTKCVVGAMLGAALQLTGIRRLPNHHRYIGDQVFLNQIIEAIQITQHLLKNEETSSGLGLDKESRSNLLQLLDTIPKTGATVTARRIIESIEIDKITIERKLKIIRKFPNLARACDQLGKAISGHTNDSYDRPILMGLIKQITDKDANIAEVIDRICPAKGNLLANLAAAFDIVERIVARRYFKRLFRLLPNVELDTIAVQGHPPVQSIASTFLDPTTRHETERRIEKECNLPLGSIVLHCPPAKGPTKIAKIYVTDGATWKKAYLRVIGKIDNNIFLEHQKAVNALEEMYRSTWRLIVSVTPPYTRNWEDASKKIGNILRGIMAGGAAVEGVSFKNDEYMIRELSYAAKKLEPELVTDERIHTEKSAIDRPLNRATAIPKKRMEAYGKKYINKLRSSEDKSQLSKELEEIRIAINRNPAFVDRFPLLEEEPFFGSDQDEIPLWNRNLTPESIIRYIKEFLGIESDK